MKWPLIPPAGDSREGGGGGGGRRGATEWLPLIYAGVVNPGQVHLSPGLTGYIWREVVEGGVGGRKEKKNGRDEKDERERKKKRAGSHRVDWGVLELML